MSDPAWQELALETRSQWLESLEDWLFAAGAVAVSLEDAADQPLLEPGPGETPVWDSIKLIALFPSELPLAPVMEALPEEWLAEGARQVSQLADRDWERAWMDEFHPMKMGQRLWVCPSWREPPDPTAVNLILDPGLAFGSGTHPTTALCLRALDQLVREGMAIVDYGCGSGILAIAALKLGASQALGIDNDPQAVVASRDNAERNQIAPGVFSVLLPDQQVEGHWAAGADVVVANILANPLIALAPRILSYLKPGATLLLAGLLEDQAEAVIAAYGEDCPLKVAAVEEGWALLRGVNPGPADP